MATPEQPPTDTGSKETERPRPVATDSGDAQGSPNASSAGEREASPVSSVSPNDALDREKLQQRVLETEAWVQRLKAARSEGTRLSQENARPAQNAARPSAADSTRPRDDVDHLIDVLNKGDDRTFVAGVLDAAERRTLNKFATENQNRELANKITAIVDEHAPDVPMDLFWSYTEDAIRIAPNDVAGQIEAAIRLARRTLAQRDEKMQGRRDANKANRQSADTLTGSRDRPRTASDDDEKKTMVDDIKAFQNARR
jgi:hypothetical protein